MKKLNNKGASTVDFMFALILVMGFSYILFTLALTLTVVEVVQYMTFSSARNFYVGHMSEEDQREKAVESFMALRNTETLSPLFRGGWFELVNNQPTVGSQLTSTVLRDYAQESATRDLFHGSFIRLYAKIMDFQVPLYGETRDDSKLIDNQFQMIIGSYLGREVSYRECENMMLRKYEEIRRLNVPGQFAPYSQVQGGRNVYIAIADNGC